MAGRDSCTFRRLICAACLALVGCSSSSNGLPADAGGCPLTAFDEGVPVPAVHLTEPRFFSFGARVPLGPEGVQVDIEDAQGTVSFDGTGPLRAFIFNVTDWSDIDRMVFSGLAVSDGTWFPFWLYCTDDGKLDRFWAERTDRPGWTGVIVDGTCAATSELATSPIDLPATTLRRVALTCGFDVHTSTGINGQVDLGSSRPGHMTYPGYAATILVFNTNDCRVGCGSRSFFELHSILWDSARGEVGFQIWYLDQAVPGVVTDNTIVLPTVTSLNVAFPDATWELGNP